MDAGKTFTMVVDDVMAAFLVVVGAVMMYQGHSKPGYTLIGLGAGYLFGRANPSKKFQ